MTTVTSVNKYQNQLVFQMLEGAEYSPYESTTHNNLKVELSGADDEVMLNGDDIEVQAGEGNNTVVVFGDSAKIETKDGEDVAVVYGNNANISVGKGNDQVYAEGNNNTVTSVDGNNLFQVFGKNNTITSGDGRNEVVTMGDNVNVTLGNGNNLVGYWGQNANITVGNASVRSQVLTLDHLFREGYFPELESKWLEKLDYVNTSEKVNSEVVYDYSSSTNPYYAQLSQEDLEYAQTVDLTEKVNVTFGKVPKYVVAKDPDGVMRLYKYSFEYNGVQYYYPRGYEGKQKYKLALNSVETQETYYNAIDTYDMIYSKNYIVDSNANANATINFGDGNKTLQATVADQEHEVDGLETGSNNVLNLTQSYAFADQSKRHWVNHYEEYKKFYYAG